MTRLNFHHIVSINISFLQDNFHTLNTGFILFHNFCILKHSVYEFRDKNNTKKLFTSLHGKKLNNNISGFCVQKKKPIQAWRGSEILT